MLYLLNTVIYISVSICAEVIFSSLCWILLSLSLEPDGYTIHYSLPVPVVLWNGNRALSCILLLCLIILLHHYGSSCILNLDQTNSSKTDVFSCSRQCGYLCRKEVQRFVLYFKLFFWVQRKE